MAGSNETGCAAFFRSLLEATSLRLFHAPDGAKDDGSPQGPLEAMADVRTALIATWAR
jgi:hypothetical protein